MGDGVVEWGLEGWVGSREGRYESKTTSFNAENKAHFTSND